MYCVLSREIAANVARSEHCMLGLGLDFSQMVFIDHEVRDMNESMTTSMFWVRMKWINK